MMRAFTMILPRSDLMDVERRLNFSKGTTASYVKEMNDYVMEHAVEDVKQANRLWDFYAKNRNHPSEFPEHFEEDTRTRFTVSNYAMDYNLPGEDACNL